MSAVQNPIVNRFEFTSSIKYPVEVIKQRGFFYPMDEKTNQQSTDKIMKHDAQLHDPNKVHPVLFPLYLKEKNALTNGKYLAVIALYYNENEGRYQSRLDYTKADDKTFSQAILDNKKNRITGWDTELEVEVYGNEPAGSGYNHEAYVMDTEKKIPVLIECWQSNPLPEGIYTLRVTAERFRGKLATRNHYDFKHPHRPAKD